MTFLARVTNVVERTLGTELAADAAAAADELEVLDPAELNLDGGTLQIGDEVHEYTVNGDDVVALTDTLTAGFSEEEPVYVYPLTMERVAYVRAENEVETDELTIRVPHSLWDRLADGIRADDRTAEVVEVDVRDGEPVIVDMLGVEPSVDGSYIDAISAGTPGGPDVRLGTIATGDPDEDFTGFVARNAGRDRDRLDRRHHRGRDHQRSDLLRLRFFTHI